MRSKLILVGMLALFVAVGVTAFAEIVPAEESVTKTDGNLVVAWDETVKDATATNGGVTVYGHVTGNVKAVNGNVRVRSGGVIDGTATAVNGKVIKEKGGKILGRGIGERPSGSGSSGASKIDVHGSVTVQKGETLKEVSTVKGNITVYGHITGDATAVMGKVDVRPGGRIDGDATAVMGDVRVRKGSKIGGDATAVMGAVIHEIGGTIDGSTTSVGFPMPKWLIQGYENLGGVAVLGGLWAVILLAQILVAALVVALIPGRMQVIADVFISQPGWSLLYGLIGLMVALPVALLLLITCVGIPFIAVEVVFLYIMWVVGSVGVKLALGQKIRRFQSPIWSAVVGAVLLGLVRLIPLAGGLIVHTLFVVGFGAVIMTGFGAAPDWFSRRVARSTPTPPPPGPTAISPPAPPAPGPIEGTSDSGGDSAHDAAS